MRRFKTWLHEWWVTLRYGSRLTRAGRELRSAVKDGPEAFVEVGPPAGPRCNGDGQTKADAEEWAALLSVKSGAFFYASQCGDGCWHTHGIA